ncbi:MAG: YkgJ family cysteine cluster protein [Polyangiales bacterium]
MDKPPDVPPDLIAEIDALAETLLARDDHADIARKFEWLLDALVMRGQLPSSYTKLATKIRGDRSTVRLSLVSDKYTKESPPIDCASLLHLCEARCCRMDVTLSAQDVADGIPFKLDEPYALPRDPYSKKCVCMDEAGACTVYDKRPASCRTYDCREDNRVWIDFEAKIPAPMPEKGRPIPKP